MNPEYSTLYSIFKHNDHNLAKRESARFFLNEMNRNAFIIGSTLAQVKMDITLDNSIKAAHQLIEKISDQTKVINYIKSIYNDNKFIPCVNPLKEVRKNYYDNFCADISEFFSTGRTENEIRQKLGKAITNLMSENLYRDVDTLENMVGKFVNSPDKEIFKKIELKDKWLRFIFGPYLYSQYYNFTGIPGGYKTTFMHILLLDLLSTGKKGLLISLEDMKEFVASKMISSKCHLNKIDVINRNNINMDGILNQFKNKGNLYIADASRNADELYELMVSYIINCDIDFIALDFIQAVLNEKGQDDTTAVNRLAQVILRVIKEYNITVISTSQTTKEKVNNVLKGGYQLGGGDEKSSSKIFDYLRYAYYLTPLRREPTSGGYNQVMKLTCDKATIGNNAFKAWEVTFNGASGYIEHVQETQYAIEN